MSTTKKTITAPRSEVVLIPESLTDKTKLTLKHWETAKLWAERIKADYKAHARGAPKRYPTPPEWDRAKGPGHLMELPTIAGKPLGECTGLEGRIMAEAYEIAAQHFKAVADARDLLSAEMTP